MKTQRSILIADLIPREYMKHAPAGQFAYVNSFHKRGKDEYGNIEPDEHSSLRATSHQPTSNGGNKNTKALMATAARRAYSSNGAGIQVQPTPSIRIQTSCRQKPGVYKLLRLAIQRRRRESTGHRDGVRQFRRLLFQRAATNNQKTDEHSSLRATSHQPTSNGGKKNTKAMMAQQQGETHFIRGRNPNSQEISAEDHH